MFTFKTPQVFPHKLTNPLKHIEHTQKFCFIRIYETMVIIMLDKKCTHMQLQFRNSCYPFLRNATGVQYKYNVGHVAAHYETNVVDPFRAFTYYVMQRRRSFVTPMSNHTINYRTSISYQLWKYKSIIKFFSWVLLFYLKCNWIITLQNFPVCLGY